MIIAETKNRINRPLEPDAEEFDRALKNVFAKYSKAEALTRSELAALVTSALQLMKGAL